MDTFDRTQGIGGTDARLIMAGHWHELWLEKTKRRPPPDLSKVFRVQLGKHTERFHLDWITEKHGLFTCDMGLRKHDAGLPWRYVTIDAWDLHHRTHVEVKHSHSQMTVREAADHYMPQLQHGLSITGCEWCWFSVIPGNDEPQCVKVSRHDAYIERLLELEHNFWSLVQQDIEPDTLDDTLIIKARDLQHEILIDGFKEDLDMSRHNEWSVLAGEFIELKPQADRCDQVKKELKALVPEDRRRCFGGGIQITRDKRGQLILREENKK